jgi:hypothetical protein
MVIEDLLFSAAMVLILLLVVHRAHTHASSGHHGARMT